jgi:hypothetical protein
VCLIHQRRHWHYNFKQIIINTDDELINGGSYNTDVDWIYTCLHHPIITYEGIQVQGTSGKARQ